MRKFSFSKYSGCGNDFILIDNRQRIFPYEDRSLIAKLTHRRLGIGADGIILLETSDSEDFAVRILNADGSEAEMCGNGIRCLGKFIKELNIDGNQFSIETLERVVSIEFNGENISVGMGSSKDEKWEIDLDSMKIDYLNTGVPHAILFTDDLGSIDLTTLGPKVRHHKEFQPKGTNFNLAQLKEGQMWMRTFERGVEGETLACGTGATAVALAASRKYGLKSPVKVHTRSGEILEITFDDQWSKIFLSGPAHLIFQGTFAI